MYNELEEYIIKCIRNDKPYSGKKVSSLKKKFSLTQRPIEDLYSEALEIETPMCKTCKIEKVKLLSLKKGFRKYCSKKCYESEMSLRNSENNKEFNKKKGEKNREKYIEAIKSAESEYVENQYSTIKEIAERFEIPAEMLRKHLSENGLVDTNRNSRIYKKNLHERLESAHLHLNNDEWVYDKIKNEKWTSPTFAKELNCSKDFVCNKLRSNGIHLSDYRQYTSSYEEKISSMLENAGVEYIRNDRKTLGGKELDIYIPSKNLAIEINGVYWHQDNGGNKKNYHLEKTERCEHFSIRLLHITDKEITFKPNLVENVILTSLGKNKRIYARKCSMKDISSRDFLNFMRENHFQGSINSSVRYGLFYENEMVAVMGFAKSRFNKNYQYEITRFCNKIGFNVVGGSSRLFTRFIKEVDPTSVISYCDRRLFGGEMYEKIGMKYSHCTPPNYVWVHNNHDKTFTRYQTQKHLLNECPKNVTADFFMKDSGYMKIYDSGQKVYTYTKDN